MGGFRLKRVSCIAGVLLGAASAGYATELTTGYNSYGFPGLIEMPAAHSLPDAELSLSTSHFAGQTRNTLTFQVTPRLSASFRYSRMSQYPISDGTETTRFDRSFSVHYRLMDEGKYRPALAFGLNDFLGTGIYRSEYLVASKTLTNQLRATAGIGWGRLGTANNFKNPLSILDERFEDRGSRDGNLGGEVEFDQIFQGDAGLFGGIEYQLNDKLSFAVELSSDGYPLESTTAFDLKSQVNYGVTYTPRPGVHLSAHYLYGSQFGAQITFAVDPKTPKAPSGLEGTPPAISPASAVALGWGTEVARSNVRLLTKRRLSATGITLHALDIRGATATVEIENNTYRALPQAIGRTARVLTGTIPSSVDTFEIVPVVNGVPTTRVTIRRADMESLAHDLDNVWLSYARADIAPESTSIEPLEEFYPKLDFGFGPYITTSLFDPDAPIRADLGVEARATYRPAPGFLLKGRVRKTLLGNKNESTRESDSVIQRVRSDTNLYEKEGDPSIPELTAAYFFRPSDNVYGRVTVGYLEPQYAGVSGELLWKPVDSNLALGFELNHVKQREFDQLFGFREYEVTTGHASLYYDFDNGFSTQIDAGRYLAGDWGATLAVDRTFENGWSIGAFATLTDIPFEDFGEGSFDKGIRLSVPMSWITGKPTKQTYSTVLRPLTRDGGARLNVSDRLYETVAETHRPDLQEKWGRFWR